MAGPTFTTSARTLKTPPVLTSQRLRRDFPSPGDAAMAAGAEGVGGGIHGNDSNMATGNLWISHENDHL